MKNRKAIGLVQSETSAHVQDGKDYQFTKLLAGQNHSLCKQTDAHLTTDTTFYNT